MTDLVLGIDGGGSKTLLCVADRQGQIVHARTAGGTNPVDNRAWAAEFAGLLVSITPLRSRIAQAAIAVGGYGESQSIDREVDARLRVLTADFPTIIGNDVYTAHDAAFAGGPGVLLIAGTGSMAVARGMDGTLSRVGGWGDCFGDEGSAYWLGREALSLITQALDGRAPATGLTAALLADMGVSADALPGTLFEWIAALQHPRSQLAALCRTVEQTAAAGDAAASELLGSAISHLARHVTTARHAAGLGPEGAWSLLGGMGNSALIQAGLEQRLGPMTPPLMPPCGGALWQAARAAGWATDSRWYGAITAGIAGNTEHLSAADRPRPFEKRLS